MVGAKIAANLVCIDGCFKNASGRAIDAEAAKIGGAALLRDEFNAEGEVRLFAVEIGGDLDCNGGTFTNLNLKYPALSSRAGNNRF